MRPPRSQEKPADYPGFTIRLANNDAGALGDLSEVSPYSTVNRLLVKMVQGTLQVCESLAVPESLIKNRIPQIHRLVWQQLAERDLCRGLPNSQSRPIKLTFPAEDRKRIFDLSHQLRWAAGQVIGEALPAYCVLAGTEGYLEQLPDIIRLYRANQLLRSQAEPESVESVSARLDLEMGKISRSKLIFDTPIPLESQDPLTQSVFPDAPGYVPEAHPFFKTKKAT